MILRHFNILAARILPEALEEGLGHSESRSATDRRYAFLNQHAARWWTVQPATCRSDVSATRCHRPPGIRRRNGVRCVRGFSAARHSEPAAGDLVHRVAIAFCGSTEPGWRFQCDC